MVNQSDSNRSPEQIRIPDSPHSSLSPDLHWSLVLPLSYLSLSLPPSPCLSFSANVRCLPCCSFTLAAARCGHSNDILIVWLQMRMKWVSEEIATCGAINCKLGVGFSASSDKRLEEETFWHRERMKLHSRILIDPIQDIQ